MDEIDTLLLQLSDRNVQARSKKKSAVPFIGSTYEQLTPVLHNSVIHGRNLFFKGIIL